MSPSANMPTAPALAAATWTPWTHRAAVLSQKLNPVRQLIDAPGRFGDAFHRRMDPRMAAPRIGFTTNLRELVVANAGAGAHFAMTLGASTDRRLLVGSAAALAAGAACSPLLAMTLYASACPVLLVGTGVIAHDRQAAWQQTRLGRAGNGLLAYGVLGAVASLLRGATPLGQAAASSEVPARNLRGKVANFAHACAIVYLRTAQLVLCAYPIALGTAVLVTLGTGGAILGGAWGIGIGLVDRMGKNAAGSAFSPAADVAGSLFRPRPTPPDSGPPGSLQGAGAEAPPQQAHPQADSAPAPTGAPPPPAQPAAASAPLPAGEPLPSAHAAATSAPPSPGELLPSAHAAATSGPPSPGELLPSAHPAATSAPPSPGELLPSAHPSATSAPASPTDLSGPGAPPPSPAYLAEGSLLHAEQEDVDASAEAAPQAQLCRAGFAASNLGPAPIDLHGSQNSSPAVSEDELLFFHVRRGPRMREVTAPSVMETDEQKAAGEQSAAVQAVWVPRRPRTAPGSDDERGDLPAITAVPAFGRRGGSPALTPPLMPALPSLENLYFAPDGADDAAAQDYDAASEAAEKSKWSGGRAAGLRVRTDLDAGDTDSSPDSISSPTIRSLRPARRRAGAHEIGLGFLGLRNEAPRLASNSFNRLSFGNMSGRSVAASEISLNSPKGERGGR